MSGRRASVEGAAFFLESADHLDDVLRVVGRGDIVFAPTGFAGHEELNVIGYDGVFRDPGDEMVLDGRHAFELQDYLAAPFISIVGLAVVRQGSAEGVAAFLSDADTARESGVFVDQLLSSAVLLDSRSSFVRADPAGHALVRAHVSADGEYRDGPDGLLLGNVGDQRAEIEAIAAEGAGRGRAFARIVDRGVLQADLDDRPWLERYVAALDLLRQWDATPARPAVSGFGGHLVTALDEGAAFPTVVSAEAPFLVTGDGEEYVLVDPTSRRRFRLGVDAARAAECLIATADESSASALLAAELGRRAG
ncbi:MAG: daptide biosynthesis RiPP recognition protein, partial [Microbacterium sp.]